MSAILGMLGLGLDEFVGCGWIEGVRVFEVAS